MSAAWRKAYSAYLFDLDGTLVDTAPDINTALNHALSGMDCAAVDETLTRHWIGHGARVVIEQALRHHRYNAPTEQVDAALKHFLDYYGNHLCDESRPYPGVVNTLSTLRAGGAKLAVVTNKMSTLSEPLLDQIGLRDYFELIVSGDTAEHPKPAPDPVNLCLRAFNLQPNACLFVGDSETDVLAARAAGVPVVCMRDGYNHGVDVTTLKPDGVVQHFADLLP